MDSLRISGLGLALASPRRTNHAESIHVACLAPRIGRQVYINKEYTLPIGLACPSIIVYILNHFSFKWLGLSHPLFRRNDCENLSSNACWSTIKLVQNFYIPTPGFSRPLPWRTVSRAQRREELEFGGQIC